MRHWGCTLPSHSSGPGQVSLSELLFFHLYNGHPDASSCETRQSSHTCKMKAQRGRVGLSTPEQMGDMVLTHNTGAWRAACWPRFPVCSGRPISYKVLSKDALLL